jgi:hypothetical protein
MQVKGKTLCRVFEVPLKVESLNIGDTFILDNGLKVYLWTPSKTNRIEAYKGITVTQSIKNQRLGCQIIKLDQKGSKEFWELLGVKDLSKIIIKSEKAGLKYILINFRR